MNLKKTNKNKTKKNNSYPEAQRTDCNYSHNMQIYVQSLPLYTHAMCGSHLNQAADALKQTAVLVGFLTQRALKPVASERVKRYILLKNETKSDPAAASFCSPFG